jgi:hypothetical protein
MRDEFQRISILASSSEILGICRRAIADIGQNVPVIVQRDNAEKEVARLKERIREMRELLALVPHYKLFASEPRGPENPCADMCIACAWEAMKSKL